MNRPVSTIVTTVLLIMSLLHVLRMVSQIPIIIGETDIPIWASIFGTLVPGALAILLRKESSR